MIHRIAAVLAVVVAVDAVAQPADAPLAPPPANLSLSARYFEQMERDLQAREGTARVVKGLGVGSLVIAHLGAAAYVIGALDNSFKVLEGALASAFFPGSGYSPPRNDYTPLLGVATVALVAGLSTIIAGALTSRGIDREREELARLRQQRLASVAPELSSAEIEAMVSARAAAAPEPTAPPTESPTPPPDAPSEPPRKPLRPSLSR